MKQDARVRMPMTVGPNQERYLLAETLTDPVYMMPLSYRIEGPLDVARLKKALHATCLRHETLKTQFVRQNVTDFTAHPDPSEVELVVEDGDTDSFDSDLRQSIIDYVMQQPDLSARSLRRFHLTRFGPNDHILTLAHHHAVSDGISLQLFLHDLFAAYDGRALELSPAPYSSFFPTDWQQSEAYRAAEEFWKSRELQSEATVELMPDYASQFDGPSSGSIDVALPAPAAEAIRAAASQSRLSTFAFVYAAIAVLMARATGSETVTSTFQSSGRRAHPGSENTVGPFSNALPLMHRVDETRVFSEFAQSLRKDMREAVSHEAYPYHHILRATNVRPVFAINSYPAMIAPKAEGLTIEFADMLVRESDFGLNFRFFDQPDRMAFTIYYAADKYRAERIALMGEQLSALLRSFAETPDAVIAHVRTPENMVLQQEIAVEAAGGLIYSRFLDHAALRPESIAINTPKRDYTYDDLKNWSSAIARQATEMEGDVVGIMAPRSAQLVAAMLGVSRAGKAFTVLDPEYPDDRLGKLIETAGLSALLVAGSTRDRATGIAAPRHVAVNGLAEFPDTSVRHPEIDYDRKTQIAYLLFTSGSTGEPKCIATGHRPLVHFVEWQASEFGVSDADTVTMLSGIAHDPVMRDIFLPLSTGARLAIPEEVDFLERGALNDWLVKTRPTVVHLTPPLGRLLVTSHENRNAMDETRWLFFGGDILRSGLIEEIRSVFSGAKAVNFYGSTETPQAIAAHVAAETSGDDAIPIGRAIPGFKITIENTPGHNLARNEPGTLIVHSPYLSLGYVEAGTLVAHESDETGARIYNTGDRAYRNTKGDLRIVGRNDDQIKIRGFRVEPADVARALSKFDEIGPCEVLPIDSGRGQELAAFVPVSESEWDEKQARSAAHDAVPHYMVPSKWIRVDRIPLLPNGKIDRKQLRELAANEPVSDRSQLPTHLPAAARTLVEKWEKILGIPQIDANQSFSELGGDSLSFVEISIASEKILGSLPERWETMSILELAQSESRQLPPMLTYVDSAMSMRAAAILLVVAGHFQVFSYGGGATTAMFLVAGFLLGRLQLLEAERQQTAKGFVRLFLKVLIPVWLFGLLLFVYRSLSEPDPNTGLLLLVENLVDYSQFTDSERGGHDMFLWYVHCFLQIIAMLALAVWLNLRRGDRRWTPMQFTAALIAFGMVGRFVLPQLWNPDFWVFGAQSLTMENYLPTTHIGTVAIGMACALVAGGMPKYQIAIALVTIGYAALTAVLYPSGGWLFLVIFAITLMVFERFVFLKVLQKPVMILSGATLFIYLTHFHWRIVMQGLGVPDVPVIYAAGAIAGGLLVWAGWQRSQSLLRRYVHLRPRKQVRDQIIDFGPKDVAREARRELP